MNDSESPKKIESLTLENFTVFENATFDFCPVINVLIGENSTGKTHALKVIYSFLKAGSEKEKLAKLLQHSKENVDAADLMAYSNELFRIFNMIKIDIIRVSPTSHKPYSKLKFKLRETDPIFLNIALNGIGIGSDCANFLPDNISFLYIPSDEFLSKTQGFISLYLEKYLPYSSIYYNLALALDSLPLREERLTEVQPILDSLQTIIAGENEKKSDFIKQENGRFYFELPEGKLDVHLIADGYRKFGTLWYLLRNGSISKNSILFWDEPETSLNPKLTRELVKILQQLAAIGVQIFIATHDYLLSYELSLLNEYPQENQVDIKFFSLHKPSRNAGVVVEAAKTLAEIDHNPIIEAYAAYHDHESALFHALENP
jgi:predicted ATPase